MRSTIIIFLLIFGINHSYADAIRFKTITNAEMEISDCDFYPNAEALILEQRGETYFEFDNFKGLCGYHKKGFRIKILNEDGKKHADIKIRCFSPESNLFRAEEILDLNAITYNLENGQIKKTKLEKSSIYRTRINKYIQEISFALPNVKNGSVIEYSYLKKSERFSVIEDWIFQQSIPVVYNEFRVTIPDIFNFQVLSLGNIQQIKMKESGGTSVGGVASHATTYTVNNIPPLENEPFVANKCDLPLRLKFILTSMHIPGYAPKQFIKSYQQIGLDFMKEDELGKAIVKGGFAKNIETVNAQMPAKEKADSIFEWMKRQMTWNNYYGIRQSKSFKNCLDEGKGSCADINLALTAAFRTHGLEAYPVILSTRGNGVIHPVYPNPDKFNYLISVLKIDDNFIFYDATDDYLPDVLPVRCLNGDALLLSESGGSLINLTPKRSQRSSTTVSMKFNEGKIITEVNSIDKDYSAIYIKEELKATGKEKYQEKQNARFVEGEIFDFSIEEADKNTVKTNFKVEQDADVDADILYLQPLKYGIIDEPFFKLETRSAAVSFPLPIQNTAISYLTIPEGYEVELPKVEPFVYGKNDALFSINFIKNENLVTINTYLALKKQVYSPDEYPMVKEFFDKLFEATKCVVVLKKK